MATTDLSITIDDGTTSVVPGPGETELYTVVVTNNGVDPVTGASISVPLPAGVASALWDFVGGSGSVSVGAPTSGTDALATTVDLANGENVIFFFQVDVDPSATGALVTTATVTAPIGTDDPDLNNNTATDTDTLTPEVDLSVTKTDGTTTVVPGNGDTYTITVTNNGPSTVNSVTLTDTIPAALSNASFTPSVGAYDVTSGVWSGLSLASGDSISMTLSGVINSSATGTLGNTVTVAPPAGTTDTNPANDTATDTDALTPEADLAITKTDGVTTVAPGTSDTYTIVVTNNGPSTAVGAAVTDIFPADLTAVSWTAVASAGSSVAAANGTGNINTFVTLLPGGTATFTAVGQISPSATGSLTNTASVATPAGATDTNPGNNAATDTDTIPTADLQVTKTDGVTSVVPGTPDTYTIVVSNNGPDTITSVTLTDTVPAALLNATFGTPSVGTYDATTGVWSGLNLAPGDSVSMTLTATIDPSATGSLTNTVTVAGTADSNPGNNSATDTNALTPEADLAIFKTDGVTAVVAGTPDTYTIVVSNNGPSTAVAAPVTDIFPAAITSVSWTAMASAGSSVGAASGVGNINTFVTLLPGGTATFTAVGQIDPSATGSLTNFATVAAPAEATDPDPANNATTDTDTIDAPAIHIVKFVNGQDADSPTGPHVPAGSTVTFTYVVTDTGNVPLANVVVTDDKLGPITSFTGDSNGNGLLDLTETWTYTQTAIAVAGQQTNTGTVTGQDANNPPGTTVTDANPANYFGGASSPSIHIVKFVNGEDADTAPGPHVSAGSTVTFTYVVTDTGDVPLANVLVTDDQLGLLLTFLTGDSNSNGQLDLTETWIYTATATALTGQQANIGTVSANDATNPSTTVTDNNLGHYFGDAPNAPGIQIVKFVNGDDADTPTGPHVAVGSTLTFTYVVTNTGSVPLANVVLTDDILGPITTVTGDSNGNGELDTTETWTYTQTATALAGQQSNIGTVTADDATNPVTTVTDINFSNYFGDAPGINIVKSVNGQDANTAPGPHVVAGSTLVFTYAVTDTGNVPLANLIVTDDHLGTITTFTGDSNGNGLLDTTETWTYTATAIAVAGQQINIGTVIANDANNPPGTTVTAVDPANYFGDTIPTADLQVTITNGATTLVPGTSDTYTITVTNNGTDPVSSFNLIDTIPDALLNATFGSPSAGSYDPGSGLWSALSLASGQSVFITLSGVIGIATGTLSNTVTVSPSAGLVDTNPGNNVATDTDTLVLFSSPYPPPPPATSANMILRRADGLYAIYDIGNNANLAAHPLAQVGTDWQFAGLGGFQVGDTTDMLLRNASTGGFEVYDISNNTITGAAFLGTVGMDWQVMGFGNFSSRGETDLILRNVNNGGLEVYNIANNQLTGANFMGTVGLDWQFSGVGNFSGAGESDMLLRNANTGGLEVYDIANNAITNAALIGAVGLDWQFSGVGNFSGVAGETDLLLRNANTGELRVYDIANNQITGSAFLGTVGLEWQFARRCPGPRRWHVRPGLAQRQHRRIRGLQHRQQSNRRRCQPGTRGLGVAARRLRGRSSARING
jgi:uncharacterized repeat protein (TIGR01451 family)